MAMTFDDLAREAGVSRATVSRFFNGSPSVKPGTKDRLEEVIRRLGYVAPAKRRGPKPRPEGAPGRRGAIALVTVGGAALVLGDPTTGAVVESLQSACHAEGFGLMLDTMRAPEEVPFSIRAGQVCAAIIMGVGALHPPERSVLSRSCVESLAGRLPCALLFSPGHAVSGVDHFTGNDVAMGSYALRALLGAGCRSFAVVHSGDAFHEASVVRGRAFADRVLLHGLRAQVYCRRGAGSQPEGNWPPPCRLFSDFSDVADRLPKDCAGAPAGVFLTRDDDLPALHRALQAARLLEKKRLRLAVATTSGIHAGEISPQPIRVDLSLDELTRNLVGRLAARLATPGLPAMTFLVPPRVL